MRKMKRVFAGALVLAMSAALFTGCGKSDDATKDGDASGSKESETVIDVSDVKLKNPGTLTVGAEMSYPPFEDIAEDGSTPIGFDVDIATEIADRLGLEVKFINTAWDGIFAGIDQNYDCVCSAVTITPQRKETMLFSDPYIENYQTVVVRKDSDLVINDFHDLEGKTIAVQKETTSDILMSDYKSTGSINFEIVANEKVPNCFTQLENREIDAVVCDSSVADSFLNKGADKYKMAYRDTEEAEEFAIALGKNNVALQKAINEALAQMKEEGVLDEIFEHWFVEE